MPLLRGAARLREMGSLNRLGRSSAGYADQPLKMDRACSIVWLSWTTALMALIMPTGLVDWKMFLPMSTPAAPFDIAFEAALVGVRQAKRLSRQPRAESRTALSEKQNARSGRQRQ